MRRDIQYSEKYWIDKDAEGLEHVSCYIDKNYQYFKCINHFGILRSEIPDYAGNHVILNIINDNRDRRLNDAKEYYVNIFEVI